MNINLIHILNLLYTYPVPGIRYIFSDTVWVLGIPSTILSLNSYDKNQYIKNSQTSNWIQNYILHQNCSDHASTVLPVSALSSFGWLRVTTKPKQPYLTHLILLPLPHVVLCQIVYEHSIYPFWGLRRTFLKKNHVCQYYRTVLFFF